MEQPLILQSSTKVENAVIWLHGLGDNKYGFEPVAKILMQVLPNTRFVLPQAPTRPVSINNGYAMPSWYDILDLSQERAINIDELNQSARTLVGLIEQQIQQGIDSRRIVLAGFSQGGAVVYHTALHYFDAPLAGVMALSTYGPTLTDDTPIINTRQQTPFLVMHGTQDNVVMPLMGKAAYQRLIKAGVKAQWLEYPMQHQVCQQQIDDIAQWCSSLTKSDNF